MLPDADDGAVVHREFNNAKRCRKLDTQLMLLQHRTSRLLHAAARPMLPVSIAGANLVGGNSRDLADLQHIERVDIDADPDAIASWI